MTDQVFADGYDAGFDGAVAKLYANWNLVRFVQGYMLGTADAKEALIMLKTYAQLSADYAQLLEEKNRLAYEVSQLNEECSELNAQLLDEAKLATVANVYVVDCVEKGYSTFYNSFSDALDAVRHMPTDCTHNVRQVSRGEL